MNLYSIKISINENKKGFALMEVIVALFLISSGIIGSYILINSTISATTHASSNFTAAYLAQEGIEIVRNIRDTNWLQGATVVWNRGLQGCSGSCDGSPDNGCIADYSFAANPNIDLSFPAYKYNNAGDGKGPVLKINTNGFYDYSLSPPSTLTNFRRKITIDSSVNYMLKVCVWVGWEDKGVSHSVIVRENLYNWR